MTGARIGLAPTVYRLLLVALPRDIRVRYGDDMVQLFGELHRDASATEGLRGALAVWWRAVTQVVRGGLQDRWGGRRPGSREPRIPERSRANMLEQLAQDLRFAIRSFARQPGFTITVVGSSHWASGLPPRSSRW